MIKQNDSDIGFTMIELMIAMVISLIVVGAAYNVFIESNRNYAVQADITDMQQSARASLEFITREMRNLDSITNIVCTADNSSITFVSIADTGTVSDPNNPGNTLVDSTKSWSTDEWQGYEVTIANGTGSDPAQTRTIISSTTDQLTVSSNWTTNPDTTSLYKIISTKGFSRNTTNNELDYTAVGSTQPFSENITALTLQGYDSAGAATCTAADIHRIGITLTVRTEKPVPSNNNQYLYYTVKTSLFLRN